LTITGSTPNIGQPKAVAVAGGSLFVAGHVPEIKITGAAIVRVKVGTWKESAESYIAIGGTWRDVVSIHKLDGAIWRTGNGT
jgi:hypothetical protein